MLAYLRLFYVVVSCLFITSTALATETIQPTQLVTSRYTLTQLGPTVAQQDLLSAIVQLHFSPRIKTVGEAMQLVLRGSGYHLASTKISNKTLQQLAAYPLPTVQRHLGPMTIRDALQTLASPAYTLIVDSVNREVSFKLSIPAPTTASSSNTI